MITLSRIDHLVLTVSDVEKTCEFYKRVLSCEIVRYSVDKGDERTALRIGDSPQKINLHPAAHPFQPAAQMPTPGSADLCFLTSTPIESVIAHFQSLQISILEGPIKRTGTLGSILSVYIRDPDGNLIEIANSL